MATDWEQVRSRIRKEIADRVPGGLTTKGVAWVAEKAGLEYSVVARFVLYEGKKRTRRFHSGSLRRVCWALDRDSSFFLTGKESIQAALWPAPVEEPDEEIRQLDPLDELREVVETLSVVDRPERGLLCRGMLLALLEIADANSVDLPGQIYRSVIRLEVNRRIA